MNQVPDATSAVPTARKPSAYFPQTDGYRGLGSLLVMYAHFTSTDMLSGHAAVQLFFVMSSFFITTMLLVDAAIHRAGLVFPAQPYRRLIETEAFAAAAHDLGIEMIGLPNLEILHAPT